MIEVPKRAKTTAQKLFNNKTFVGFSITEENKYMYYWHSCVYMSMTY